MSRGLLGRPFAVPPAISRAHTKPAFSSNGSTRPANSAGGPSGPENQRSNSLSFFPGGFSGIRRRISATVNEEINRSSSDCSAIHATSASDGTGLVTLPMISVSRRRRLTGQPRGPASLGGLDPDRRRPEAIGVEPQNLEPGHPSLAEALPVAFQRSLLRRGAHGGFLRTPISARASWFRAPIPPWLSRWPQASSRGGGTAPASPCAGPGPADLP